MKKTDTEKTEGYFEWKGLPDFISNYQRFTAWHGGSLPKIIIGREVLFSELCSDMQVITENKF